MYFDCSPAPQIATQEIDSSTSFTVENGEPIWIYGFMVSYVTDEDQTVTVLTGDGSETITTVSLNGGITDLEEFISDIRWKADKGISFTIANAGTKRISVFYMKPGI